MAFEHLPTAMHYKSVYVIL